MWIWIFIGCVAIFLDRAMLRISEAIEYETDTPYNRSQDFKLAAKLSAELKQRMGIETATRLCVGQRLLRLYLDYDSELAKQLWKQLMNLYAQKHFCQRAKTPLTSGEREEIAEIFISTLEAEEKIYLTTSASRTLHPMARMDAQFKLFQLEAPLS